MSVLDKFLSIMKLDDEEDYEDDDNYDSEDEYPLESDFINIIAKQRERLDDLNVDLNDFLEISNI